MQTELTDDGDLNPDFIEFNARPRTCQACLARSTAATAKAGHEDSDPLAGVYWSIEPAVREI